MDETAFLGEGNFSVHIENSDPSCVLWMSTEYCKIINTRLSGFFPVYADIEFRELDKQH
jgi:hypothetical protein